MTPVTLELLLHTYYRTDPYPSNSPAIVEAKIYLTSNGLAEYVDRDEIVGDGSMRLTDRGKAHVKALLLVPLPHHCWVTHGGTIYHNIE